MGKAPNQKYVQTFGFSSPEVGVIDVLLDNVFACFFGGSLLIRQPVA